MGSGELDGVVVYSPEGALIGRIRLPERCANLCDFDHVAQAALGRAR